MRQALLGVFYPFQELSGADDMVKEYSGGMKRGVALLIVVAYVLRNLRSGCRESG